VELSSSSVPTIMSRELSEVVKIRFEDY